KAIPPAPETRTEQRNLSSAPESLAHPVELVAQGAVVRIQEKRALERAGRVLITPQSSQCAGAAAQRFNIIRVPLKLGESLLEALLLQERLAPIQLHLARSRAEALVLLSRESLLVERNVFCRLLPAPFPPEQGPEQIVGERGRVLEIERPAVDLFGAGKIARSLERA